MIFCLLSPDTTVPQILLLHIIKQACILPYYQYFQTGGLMKKSLQRKLACNINLSPELNRLVLQSKRSWDEVACMLKTPVKKGKNRVNNTKK